jgi:hypothetical protein
MKKMFKLFMCAAIVAAGFTACSEEVTPIDPEPNPTETGVLTVKLVNPTTYAEDNGTTEESTLSDVTIFVFNSTGVCQVEKTLNLADLDVKTNPYKKIDIDVPTGIHTVYAGVNLTSGDATKMREVLGSELGFNKVVYLGTTSAANPPVFTPVLTEIQKLYADNHFPMFSTDVQSINIKSVPAGAANPNEVTISLDRLVAKITVRKGSDFSNAANLTADGATFSATDVTWDMGNLNGKIYPYAKANNNTNDPNYDDAPGDLTDEKGLAYRKANFVHNFDTKSSPTVGYTTPVDANNTDIGKRVAKYAPENNSAGGRGHESTYASIRAKFAPTALYTYTANDPEPKVSTDAPPTISESVTLYVVAYTQTYYFKSPTDATAYAEYIKNTLKKEGYDVKIYNNQYCYYPLFMGTGNTQRNNYYDITLSKFLGLGDPTGELDEDKGNQTVDKKGLLDVTISVNPWTIVNEEHPLQ